MASFHANLLEQKKAFTWEKSSTPRGFSVYTNMAAVSLFWNPNMAAVTSCEKRSIESRCLFGLTGFGSFMANRSTVLWCRRDLWVETGHSNLPCFDLRRKTTPNNQRASKPCKMVMSWVQITQKKQQQAEVYVSKICFYIYAYISRFSQQNRNSHTKSLNRS